MDGQRQITKLVSKASAMLAAFLCAGIMGQAHAALEYYTFQGTVTSLSDPDNLISSAGLSLGSSVSYTFGIDFTADGTFEQVSGTVFTQPDLSTQDRFFADYISGSALPVPANPLYNNGTTHVAEYNFGYDLTSGAGGGLFTNSINNRLAVTVSGGTISGLAVGDGNTVGGPNIILNNHLYYTGGTSSVSFLGSNNLVLTSISKTAPVTAVPEPEIYAMMGVGLGIMGWVARRKRRIQA